MDWWDQGKFYLREVTRSYSRCKAADQRSRKTSLTRQMSSVVFGRIRPNSAHPLDPAGYPNPAGSKPFERCQLEKIPRKLFQFELKITF